MKLKITNIRDRNDLAKERVVMKVELGGNLGEYLLIQSSYSENSVTNGVYETYWFPDKDVSAGDFVVVYSKTGINSEKPFNGVKSHFFYLGKSHPIWDTKDRAAVLMHAPVWESFKPE
ncbi:hypothetical protein hmeg3_20845 [Herbaspirillum sp. meg3]|uniref:hypothetical protein n=1 Tax=Herbaspirillum sp. meg3 TaxID=2025949 RepID=UPI000B98118D|nr:hypothetical protein [Herbaspirillum sp. meg3]ASU40504.1 hypothetical protein hmeg3_20845 [Herbaspirillum sp. meg3]